VGVPDSSLPDLELQSKPRDLCLIRLSAIGDTCHALAVVRRLQDNWSDIRITWIIGRTEYRLMSGVEDVDFVVFDKSKGRAAYRDVRAALGERRFDLALCMHASWRANFLIRAVRAPVRLGFDRARARDFQWLFTNRRIPAAHGEHALDAMMGFATAIGAREQPVRWDIPLDDADRAFAAGFVAPGRPLVVISPCSSQRRSNFRNWEVANFVAIARRLESEHGARVVVTGGPSPLEAAYGRRIAGSSAGDNLAGRTTLGQVAALLAAADLVICPDSGPAHVATALGTPVIGLYATSNPERTGPYLNRQLTVNRYPDAVRRYLGRDVAGIRWGRRVRNPDAMNLITIDEVMAKIEEFFGSCR